jgi:hypothetical protein
MVGWWWCQTWQRRRVPLSHWDNRRGALPAMGRARSRRAGSARSASLLTPTGGRSAGNRRRRVAVAVRRTRTRATARWSCQLRPNFESGTRRNGPAPKGGYVHGAPARSWLEGHRPGRLSAAHWQGASTLLASSGPSRSRPLEGDAMTVRPREHDLDRAADVALGHRASRTAH